jgi:hypothetical protein
MHDVDIMLITETKLLKTDKIQIESYNLLRKERNTDTRGGGVAILVKRGIPYIKAQLTANGIECTAIKPPNPARKREVKFPRSLTQTRKQ